MIKALSGHSPNTHIVSTRTTSCHTASHGGGGSANQNMEMPNFTSIGLLSSKEQMVTTGMWKPESSFATGRSAEHWKDFKCSESGHS